MIEVKTLAAIGIIGGLILVPLYMLRDVEPTKTYLGPYITQAEGFVREQLGNLQDMVGQYAGHLTALMGTAFAGVIALVKSYVDRQRRNVMNAAQTQVVTVESKLREAFGLNQELQAKNVELEAKLERLEDVESNVAVLQEKLDAKMAEVEQLTAERNQAQRDLALVVNPPEEPVRVE